MPPPHHRHGSPGKHRHGSPGKHRHGSRSPSPRRHGRSHSPKHGRKHGHGKKHEHRHGPKHHGPKHHGPPGSAGCGKFEEVWWDDLPEKAMKKAKILGYNERKWDGDKDVPCFKKKFVDLKMKEKKASAYLGLDIFEEHDDLDEDWDDLDDEIKEFATKLGYDQEIWDNDEEPPTEDKAWDDLTEDEIEGAKYFGYSKATWNDGDDEEAEDESEEEAEKEAPEEVEELANEVPIEESEAEDEPAPEASAPPLPDEAPEEEPEKVEEAPVVAAVQAPIVAAAVASEPAAEKEEESKPKFFMSKNFGGEGGSAFDHMNRRRITKITVRAGKFVDGLSVTYMNGATLKNGGDGGEEFSMELPEGEYVNEVKLRHGNVIQSITFITNKGNKLGPCGSGKGGGLFAKEGEAIQVKAPEGYRLVGLKGREGKWLDAVGFRWGPVPARFR